MGKRVRADFGTPLFIPPEAEGLHMTVSDYTSTRPPTHNSANVFCFVFIESPRAAAVTFCAFY